MATSKGPGTQEKQAGGAQPQATQAQPQGTAAAQYRVGVKFTDLEPSAVEAFMGRHGIEETHGKAQGFGMR